VVDNIKDRTEGAADKLKGKARESLGDLTDNEQAKRQGQVEQGKGELKEDAADIKDKADDVFRQKTNSH
jgi:uncharacterized protein YjbJ (UPF0337 family)